MQRQRWLVYLVPLAIFASDLSHGDEVARRSFVEANDRASKFQQPDSIFPSRPLKAAASSPLPRADVPENFDIRYQWEGREYGIDEFNERTRSNALLILKDGRIVTEIYRIGAMTVGLSRSLDCNQQHLTNVIWLLTTDI